MKCLKINFADFGKIDPEKNWITDLLRTRYTVQIDDNPDYLFYSTGGQDHHRYDCIRIFYTGENLIPNFNYCDYAIGFHRLTFANRYFRFPLWALDSQGIQSALNQNFFKTEEEALNRGFCACVIGNSQQTDGARLAFFNCLNQYKKISSGGRWNNNVGGPVANKVDFQSHYKFSMAFENTQAEGYTTEKILDAYAGHSVPIYYGDPTVIQDFNPDSFINAHDFDSWDSLVNYIQKIDTDDRLYLKMLKAPVFQEGALQTYSFDNLMNFLSQIFDAPYAQAKKRAYFKPYQDIDCAHIKMKDFKQILKHQILKPFTKGK